MYALTFIITSLLVFALAYRFYAKFIITKVLVIDENRATPAHRMRDGRDYNPTNRWVLFGHHFAAIAIITFAWGYMVYQGEISTIWPMFGVANQLLSALMLVLVVIIFIESGRKCLALLRKFHLEKQQKERTWTYS